ncbi:hypothetical protein LTR36_010182 [Oleoguttula mirabilis]|uniref:Mitochondrial pyruvate carrier n=1 Tax=Oleoguttula mirabilis TaxID=1507867 RepID=A0AAV9JTC9_9PEZI|nr:hypothetical protein LTR36_010182 [Oleoguttula mirabilis]
MASLPRFSLRTAQQALRQPAVRQNLRFAQRRGYQAPAENPANIEAPPAVQSGFGKLWNSPVGPKTVHFWAPIMKWGLVLAGAADFARPASSLSLSQNSALVATGLIWTRWCFVIKPRNLFLASVNFLLFCVGTTQVTRILRYQASIKGDSVGAEAEKAAKEEEGVLEKVVRDPKSVVDAVTKGK